MIQKYVGTRSATQIRSHAQKYDLKLNKKQTKHKKCEPNIETKEDDIKVIERLTNIQTYIKNLKLLLQQANELKDINQLMDNLQIVTEEYILVNDAIKGSNVVNSFGDISKSIEQCKKLLNKRLHEIKQRNTTCCYLYELM